MVSSDIRFLRAVEMGLGAWQWGDRFVWQYGRGYSDDDIRQAFQISVAEGIRFIDTAEVYGSGSSERWAGKFLKETDQPILIATKFFPLPWRLTQKFDSRRAQSEPRTPPTRDRRPLPNPFSVSAPQRGNHDGRHDRMY